MRSVRDGPLNRARNHRRCRNDAWREDTSYHQAPDSRRDADPAAGDLAAGNSSRAVCTVAVLVCKITAAGLEITVFKQPSIRDNTMLIDHLLELAKIVPHPDLVGVRVAEQLVDDVLH